MARIERRPAGPRRAATQMTGTGGAIQGKARARLASELAARIVLSHEFHVSVEQLALLSFVLDTQVWQFEMAIDDGQIVIHGKGRKVAVVLCIIGLVLSISIPRVRASA